MHGSGLPENIQQYEPAADGTANPVSRCEGVINMEPTEKTRSEGSASIEPEHPDYYLNFT